ncbi:unnamed protein product [Heligmosomoides polygyrus]|uniref:SEA domain-containing protein n=1 Tax=Heligmosomoides polygyrus TaxID=6339 RepID=A0A3P7TCY6_HELPZ|nr:unnamed protein product [Heligmosomoides polygyrus]
MPYRTKVLVLVLAFALGFLMCTGTPHIRPWHIEFNRVLALTTSSLRAYNAVAVLNDLRNSGDDVLVSFRLTLQLRAPLDERSVQSLLRTQYTRIETELGGNAVIDPNSITVTRSFM